MRFSINQQFQQAVQDYQQRRYEQALTVLTAITRSAAGFAAAWHVRALTERKLGLTQQSFNSFTQAIKLAPLDAEIHNNFANLLKQLKRFQEAERLFVKAIQLKPGFFDANYNLALLLLDNKRFKNAETLLWPLVQQQPANINANLALIRCLQDKSQPDVALQVLSALKAHHPSDMRLLKLHAELLRQSGNVEQAIALLQPMQGDVMIDKEKALCLFLSGEQESAQVLLLKAIEHNPAELSLHQLLADIRWQSGDANWLGSYQQVLEQAPQLSVLRLDYIARLIKANELAQAESVVDLQLAQQKTSDLLFLKGFLRREAGDAEVAVDILAQARANSEYNSELEIEFVTALLAAKRFAEASEVAKTLTSCQPLNQAGWAMLAACYKFSGETQRYRNLYRFDQFIRPYSLPVPPGYADIASFNNHLRQEVELLHTSKRHPLAQSLRYGTQTEDNLFLRDSAVVSSLKQALISVIKHYVGSLPADTQHPFLNRIQQDFLFTGAWSVRLNRQGFHRNHYHSEGWISGCYYIAVPEAVDHKGSGWIKFGQPELGNQQQLEADYLVKPKAGLVVLFPSMMWHGTEPFDDENYRVTVAFDLVPLT